MITELDHYQEEARKTMKSGMPLEEQNKYFTMKMAEEVGEISAALAKHYYHGKPLDLKNLLEELSDLAWYLANMAGANGFKLSEVATYNIEKLRKRHGESYNKDFYQPL